MSALFSLSGTLKRFSMATTREGYTSKYEVDSGEEVFVVVFESPDRPDLSDLSVGAVVDVQGTLEPDQVSGDLRALSIKKARA